MMSLRFGFISLIIIMGIGLAACSDSKQVNKDDRYPWQITVMDDGSSRVFGIQFGVTRVSEAKQRLGPSPKIALFENPDGSLSLELFYKEFDRAGLSGKLVLSLGHERAELKDFRQQAVKKERLESGVLQYRLDPDAQARIESWPVTGMTYVPYANLEEQVILARFGEPAKKIRSHEQAEHWLYPDKGLDIIVNAAGKEILQYVAPAEFARLENPLVR